MDEVDEALFAAAIKVSIHSGNKAKFWKASWLQEFAPATMFPALFNHTRKKNRSVAGAISNENWFKDIMHHITPSLFLDYIRLWHSVSSFPFDQTDQDEDEIIWSRSANGAYSAKSAYNMQFGGGLDSEFPKAIWQVWAPNRCKFFLWLLLQNRADRLMLREWPNQYFCPLCIRNLETVDHLVKECPVSRQLWTEISNWSKMPSLHPSSWPQELSTAEWFRSLPGRMNAAKSKRNQITGHSRVPGNLARAKNNEF
jgi:hypothetical protein